MTLKIEQNNNFYHRKHFNGVTRNLIFNPNQKDKRMFRFFCTSELHTLKAFFPVFYHMTPTDSTFYVFFAKSNSSIDVFTDKKHHTKSKKQQPGLPILYSKPFILNIFSRISIFSLVG
jgi:hypothetical protein